MPTFLDVQSHRSRRPKAIRPIQLCGVVVLVESNLDSRVGTDDEKSAIETCISYAYILDADIKEKIIN